MPIKFTAVPLSNKILIMNIVERAKAPTPKFFRILRSIGLSLLAISGSIMAAPVALPAAVVSVAGYIAVAGAAIILPLIANKLKPILLKILKNFGVGAFALSTIFIINIFLSFP